MLLDFPKVFKKFQIGSGVSIKDDILIEAFQSPFPFIRL